MSRIPLERDALMAAAVQSAGLDDFGDLFFIEPLDVLLSALTTEADLNDAALKVRPMQLVNSLVNRLRTEDYIKRHPEILDEEILVDAVIVGLPRTGSTMLHRLLAADPGNTAMQMWEGGQPAPWPEEDLGTAKELGNPIGRQKMGEKTAAYINQSSPGFGSIHDVNAYSPEEEILLLEHCFMSSVPESGFYIPSYTDYLKGADHSRAYQDLKRFLQFLQWQRPERRGKKWVLKTPQHVPLVDVVLKTFPGAKIVMTHRDPVETVPSFCSMVAHYAGPWTNHLDEKAIGKLWADRLAWNLDQFMQQRDALGEAHFIDTDYRKTITDPLGVARDLYAQLGRTVTASGAAQMKEHAAANKKNKHGKHHYTAAQFGLSDSGIADQFAAYRGRYIKG
ncbi:MAG: sulfotransferase [Alphaproteobacteria bacterium]